MSGKNFRFRYRIIDIRTEKGAREAADIRARADEERCFHGSTMHKSIPNVLIGKKEISGCKV